ncbi:MAG TPA: c-type cytochrome, partial [Blastocatellia bacterium]
FLLPFFDRREERHPLRRPLATALLTLVIGGSIGLIFLAKHQDKINPEFAEKLKRQEEEMRVFFDKPFEPQVIGAGAAPLANGAKPVEPPQAYAQNCAACHGDNGEGKAIFPALVGVASKPRRSKEDLLKILDDSEAYGLNLPMPKSFPKISPEDKQKIVEWLVTLKP